MIISKHTLEEYLRDSLNCCSDEFDELEEGHEFYFDDEWSGSCHQVATKNFRIDVDEFVVEVEEGEVFSVSGKGNASYEVIGSVWDGDEECGGYIECAGDDSTAEFEFVIWMSGNEFDDNISISII